LQVIHPIIVELQRVQTPLLGNNVLFTQVKQYVAAPEHVTQGKEQIFAIGLLVPSS
jgi:hypothetical protein